MGINLRASKFAMCTQWQLCDAVVRCAIAKFIFEKCDEIETVEKGNELFVKPGPSCKGSRKLDECSGAR
jgi:hypothetical protein